MDARFDNIDKRIVLSFLRNWAQLVLPQAFSSCNTHDT